MTDRVFDKELQRYMRHNHTDGGGAYATLTGSETLTNKTLTSPAINTSVSGTAILDEDTMSSNSNTQLATQQSIKAYVDANAGGDILGVQVFS